MAKESLGLKDAIQNLKINQPFDLRKQKRVGLQSPEADLANTEALQIEEPNFKGTKNDVPKIQGNNSEGVENKESKNEEPQ